MIEGGCDQMHGGTMHESPRLKCTAMGTQAWERRQQGRVNIQKASAVKGHQRALQNPHETRQHNNVRLKTDELSQHFLLKIGPLGVISPGDDGDFNVRLRRDCDARRILPVGNHPDHRVRPLLLAGSAQNRLEVGAPSGNHHDDTAHESMVAPARPII